MPREGSNYSDAYMSSHPRLGAHPKSAYSAKPEPGIWETIKSKWGANNKPTGPVGGAAGKSAAIKKGMNY